MLQYGSSSWHEGAANIVISAEGAYTVLGRVAEKGQGKTNKSEQSLMTDRHRLLVLF